MRVLLTSVIVIIGSGEARAIADVQKSVANSFVFRTLSVVVALFVVVDALVTAIQTVFLWTKEARKRIEKKRTKCCG